MKRFILLVLTAAICVCFAACSTAGENGSSGKIEPQISKMKSICELATMQCYYHNVAKYSEEGASGALWWKKDRKFWVEYSGIVTIGIDASYVSMKIDGDTVTIEIPPAQVFGCKVDEKTLNKDSFIIAQNSAPVGAEHQTEAFREAQEKMREAAERDTALLNGAQQRAQKLLEDYVLNIGNSIGKAYTVKWNYIGQDPASDTQAAQTTTEP